MSALRKPQKSFKPKRKKPESIFMRWDGFCLVPADATAERQLREKKFSIGQILKIIVRKLRNPKFNRLVHKIGQLCVKNIDDFRHMDAHAVLKRIQLEGNIHCDEVAVKPSGVRVLIPKYVMESLRPVLALFGLGLTDTGLLIIRIPLSLSFESMDEAEYHDVAKRICRYISEVYWPSLEPWQIEEMADLMVDE